MALEGTSKLATWKGYLLHHITRANGCYFFYSRTPAWTAADGKAKVTLTLVGKPTEVAVVRYLFAYVCDEIDRLSKIEAKRLGGSGRTWHNNFKLGAVRTIGDRLKEERKMLAREAEMEAEMDGGTALMLVKSGLARIEAASKDAEAFAKSKRKLSSGSRSRSRLNESAYEAGQRAGRNVSLGGRPASGGNLGSGS